MNSIVCRYCIVNGNLNEFAVMHDNIPDLENALKKDVEVLLNINQSEFLHFGNSIFFQDYNLRTFGVGTLGKQHKFFYQKGSKFLLH